MDEASASEGARCILRPEGRACAVSYPGVWLPACSSRVAFSVRWSPLLKTSPMFSQFLRRHAAAGLYLACITAALLSAVGLVAYAEELGQTPRERSASNCARNAA